MIELSVYIRKKDRPQIRNSYSQLKKLDKEGKDKIRGKQNEFKADTQLLKLVKLKAWCLFLWMSKTGKSYQYDLKKGKNQYQQ